MYTTGKLSSHLGPRIWNRVLENRQYWYVGVTNTPGSHAWPWSYVAALESSPVGHCILTRYKHPDWTVPTSRLKEASSHPPSHLYDGHTKPPHPQPTKWGEGCHTVYGGGLPYERGCTLRHCCVRRQAASTCVPLGRHERPQVIGGRAGGRGSHSTARSSSTVQLNKGGWRERF